jgi:hypothetical protein
MATVMASPAGFCREGGVVKESGARAPESVAVDWAKTGQAVARKPPTPARLRKFRRFIKVLRADG